LEISMNEQIVILDFGSQYTQVIAAAATARRRL
jgi:GMP synthase-like glutamine amidotransferase